MHEMSLMMEVLTFIEKDAMERKMKKVDKVELLVGELSNALPDALMMAFDVLKTQGFSIFEAAAELIIKEEKAKARCETCDIEYTPDQWIAICPTCHQPSGKLISGEALSIQSYQGI